MAECNFMALVYSRHCLLSGKHALSIAAEWMGCLIVEVWAARV